MRLLGDSWTTVECRSDRTVFRLLDDSWATVDCRSDRTVIRLLDDSWSVMVAGRFAVVLAGRLKQSILRPAPTFGRGPGKECRAMVIR